MSVHLLRDLDRLKRDILDMGALVERAANKAISALVDRRLPLAEEVIRDDVTVDEREVAIEVECMKVLALHQPVAGDLRFVITVLKVNNDLERVGDLAVNIAERATYLCSHEPIAIPGAFKTMAEKTRRMLCDSLDALIDLDTEKARAIRDADDEVDELNRNLFGAMQAHMHEDPATIERALQVLSACRHMERMADLATNIAEDVVFLVDGDVIRHRKTD